MGRPSFMHLGAGRKGVPPAAEDEPSQEGQQHPVEQLNELMDLLTQLMQNSHLRSVREVQPGPRPLGGLSPGLHTFPGGFQYAWGRDSGGSRPSAAVFAEELHRQAL